MKKLLFTIIVFIGVFVLMFFIRGSEDTWICSEGKWLKHGNPSAPMPTSGCGTEESGASARINFDEWGHLVKDNPGMKPGVWFLVYEKPGKPALTAELQFDSESVCEYNGDKGKCPDVLLLSSALTRVRGIETGGVVKVISAVSGAVLE